MKQGQVSQAAEPLALWVQALRGPQLPGEQTQLVRGVQELARSVASMLAGCIPFAHLGTRELATPLSHQATAPKVRGTLLSKQDPTIELGWKRLVELR